jgi:hypothetical protein
MVRCLPRLSQDCPAIQWRMLLFLSTIALRTAREAVGMTKALSALEKLRFFMMEFDEVVRILCESFEKAAIKIAGTVCFLYFLWHVVQTHLAH